jgi:hypothetical protein
MIEQDRRELERDAIALMQTYGFILPPPAKVFFRKLATALNWHSLEKVIPK